MCGIAGMMDTRGQRPIDRARLATMTGRLAHRGPDGDGFYHAPGVGLGHRRLAIIDLAGGKQPLSNEDDTVFITFNGEIYNFQELASELKAKGHRFRTHSDTEAIVHAWEEWGENCVTRLRGMFAFAIWDEKRQSLFLARDRLGKKPLFYAVLDNGLLLFGSELKSLLTHPELPRQIDPAAVEDYFALGYVPESKSIYRAVRKLPPAHTLLIRRGLPLPAPQEYWDFAQRESSWRGEEAARDDLLDRLGEAVKLRLISDVPLGAFLSGGVDSSAVVALMSQGASAPVNSFSIGFTQAEYDETAYADRIAAQYGTRHLRRVVDADDFDLIDRLAGIYDEPFADPSAMPTFRVCALARERVTVALSGDGGDEMFAGYRRYKWHALEERVRGAVPSSLRRPLFGALGRLYPKADWAPRSLRAKAMLLELAAGPLDGYFESVSQNGDAVRRRLFRPAFRRELQGYTARAELAAYFDQVAGTHPLFAAQYVDAKTYLPGDILVKVDRASMASSLEVRAPFLDHQFAEWAINLPPGLKLHRGTGKYILKRAFEGRLPSDILYRPKRGFSVPLAAWFRGPLRGRVKAALATGSLLETGWFDHGFITEAVDQHMTGRRNNSTLIWSLLMFEAFLKDVHQGPATRSGDSSVSPIAAMA